HRAPGCLLACRHDLCSAKKDRAAISKPARKFEQYCSWLDFDACIFQPYTGERMLSQSPMNWLGMAPTNAWHSRTKCAWSKYPVSWTISVQGFAGVSWCVIKAVSNRIVRA